MEWQQGQIKNDTNKHTQPWFKAETEVIRKIFQGRKPENNTAKIVFDKFTQNEDGIENKD